MISRPRSGNSHMRVRCSLTYSSAAWTPEKLLWEIRWPLRGRHDLHLVTDLPEASSIVCVVCETPYVVVDEKEIPYIAPLAQPPLSVILAVADASVVAVGEVLAFLFAIAETANRDVRCRQCDSPLIVSIMVGRNPPGGTPGGVTTTVMMPIAPTYLADQMFFRISTIGRWSDDFM